MTSYLRRQQWIAQVQAMELGKLWMGQPAQPGKAAPPPTINGARYVSPDTMLKSLGVKL